MQVRCCAPAEFLGGCRRPPLSDSGGRSDTKLGPCQGLGRAVFVFVNLGGVEVVCELTPFCFLIDAGETGEAVLLAPIALHLGGVAFRRLT